jgi:hypothetical protein
MKKKTPFLDFYKECIKNVERMPEAGLCNCFGEFSIAYGALVITGSGMPPVSLHVETPFIKKV